MHSQDAKAAEKAAKKAKAAAKAEANKAAANAPKATNSRKQALAAEAEEKKVHILEIHVVDRSLAHGLMASLKDMRRTGLGNTMHAQSFANLKLFKSS